MIKQMISSCRVAWSLQAKITPQSCLNAQHNIVNDIFDYDTDKINKPKNTFGRLKIKSPNEIQSYEYTILMMIILLSSISLVLGHIYFHKNA